MLHLEMRVGERCQEWPSPRSFKFYVCRGLPASHVKATALWRSSLPLRNSGGKLWRRNWRLSGRGRTGTLGCLAPAHSACWLLPPRLWASYQSGAPLTILAASCPQELGLCLSCHRPLPPHTMWGREQHLCCAGIRTLLFLRTRAPAEHKAVLKYPWCSQWDFGHFCLGFSDLRSNSHINQCEIIMFCREGRVSAHSR